MATVYHMNCGKIMGFKISFKVAVLLGHVRTVVVGE